MEGVGRNEAEQVRRLHWLLGGRAWRSTTRSSGGCIVRSGYKCVAAVVASGRWARGRRWRSRRDAISAGRSTSCRICSPAAGGSGKLDIDSGNMVELQLDRPTPVLEVRLVKARGALVRRVTLSFMNIVNEADRRDTLFRNQDIYSIQEK